MTHSANQPDAARGLPRESARRLLITAGPTHEPIDAVRYLGNRSSGRLGVALADAAAARGWQVTLLLGPSPLSPGDTRVSLRRFRSAADLEALLKEEFPGCHTLVMAAAVADYRPASGQATSQTKIKRTDGKLTLELESTPDLLAACAAVRSAGQRLIGFALEPRDRLLASAQAKLERKSLDAIVANPLETMDSPQIEATLLFRSASRKPASTPGPIAKEDFADWLLDRLEEPGEDTGDARLNPPR